MHSRWAKQHNLTVIKELTMKRYRIEFTNQQYLYVDAYSVADAYFKAVGYEEVPGFENRYIFEIEFVRNR